MVEDIFYVSSEWRKAEHKTPYDKFNTLNFEIGYVDVLPNKEEILEKLDWEITKVLEQISGR